MAVCSVPPSGCTLITNTQKYLGWGQFIRPSMSGYLNHSNQYQDSRLQTDHINFRFRIDGLIPPCSLFPPKSSTSTLGTPSPLLGAGFIEQAGTHPPAGLGSWNPTRIPPPSIMVAILHGPVPVPNFDVLVFFQVFNLAATFDARQADANIVSQMKYR